MLLTGCIKKASEASTTARYARHSRKAPYRQRHQNRPHGEISLSTKACGQVKIRVIKVFDTIFLLSGIKIENVKALTKLLISRIGLFRLKNWAKDDWCHSELAIIASVTLFDSYTNTYLTRQNLCLKKSKVKLSKGFNSHCVDS